MTTLTDSRTDVLTGLCNRRGLDHVLAVQLAVMGRYGSLCSLVLLDIDCFKNVNDQQGHLYGDQTLCELARLLEEESRETDVIARYGGDEFIIVMPQSDLDGAMAMAERLRLKVEQKMSFTISGGVACAEKNDTPDALFHRADVALYGAKLAGRNRVFCHRPGGAETAPCQAPVVATQTDDILPCQA